MRKPITQDRSPFLQQYEYFVACADAGSLVKASERLGIQQAGLSKVIRKLEEDRGEKLFYRDASGVQLNTNGRALYNCLIQTRNFWKITNDQYLKSQNGYSGTLSIGAHSSIASVCFPKLVRLLLERYPHIQPEFTLGSSIEITRQVAQHRLDLGLVINPVKNRDLIASDLGAEYLALWSRSGKESRELAYNPEMYSPQQLLKKHSKRRHLAIADYEVIANIARQSDVMCCLPSPLASRHGLKQIGQPIFNARLKLIYHRDRFSQEQGELVRSLKSTLAHS